MSFFSRIWDGLLSLIAALAILVIALIPAWYAHVAIAAGLAPALAYIAIALLAFGAALVAFDFFKKASNGVAPTRTRRRS